MEITHLASHGLTQSNDNHFSAAATVLDIGSGPILLICDHASNHVPEHLNDLGLIQDQLDDHIGWDIGASALTQSLSKHLNAPAVLANFSRLVIDANRASDAHDLVPIKSDGVAIPGNMDLTSSDRAARIDSFHRPFHDSVAALIETRQSHAPIKAMVAIHSFTPQLSTKKTQARPWHVGLLFHRDERLAHAVATQCQDEPDLVIGLNEPYAPTDGVYYTIDRHATAQNMLNLLIEVRNDLLRTAHDIEMWAQRLARWISNALELLWASDTQTTEEIGLLT
jgi:predicted N-formylglutamate amidohydrolase